MTSEAAVLKRYARAVAPMRKAFQDGRFGLALGAGVSKAFNFGVPDWKALLASIAQHPKVMGEAVDDPNGTPGARADLLYRHFTSRVHADLTEGTSPLDGQLVEKVVKGEWRTIIRDILYAGSPDPEHLSQTHPYLGEYLALVVESPLTITYNFDAYLEMMIAARPPRTDERGRPYEVVFDGSVPFRSKTGVIYHPNGYLPLNVLERASDELVFSEEEFGDQLLASVAGRFASLSHHLSKSTCLFVGLSLADENLRFFLRRNAVNNPGHHHYIIEWFDPGHPIGDERRQALFDYRYHAFNLITLFLHNEEIASLGRLLRMGYGEYARLCDQVEVPTKYVYYLTGVPGIGKTTALHHLRSLSIYDEWLTDPIPLLAKPHNALEQYEKEVIDDWVAQQFRKKNESLLEEREGIFVVERGPLDPVSFVEDAQVSVKALWYRPRVVPTMFDFLCPGRVILLWGDPQRVSARVASRQNVRQPPDYLASLQTRLRSVIYALTAVKELRSTDWTIPQLVREIAREIHLGNYEPLALKDQLEQLGQYAPLERTNGA